MKLSPKQIQLRARGSLSKPILQWDDAQKRFFSTIYETLSPKVLIDASDFHVQPGLSLGDVSAQYKIFGGASQIALSANALLAEFPNVNFSEVALVDDIILSSAKSFLDSFPEVFFNNIESQLSLHSEILDDFDLNKYISSKLHMKIDRENKEYDGFHIDPSLRFEMKDDGGQWTNVILFDESKGVPGGVFYHRTIHIFNPEGKFGVDEVSSLISKIDTAALQLLGLEFVGAAQSTQ